MPSTRGMGSKMIFRRSGSVSSTRAVRLIVPKGTSSRPSGQGTLASVTSGQVRGLRGRLLVGKILGAFFGPDPEAPVLASPLGVGELEGSHGEERLPGEAGRDRLGRLDEALR